MQYLKKFTVANVLHPFLSVWWIRIEKFRQMVNRIFWMDIEQRAFQQIYITACSTNMPNLRIYVSSQISKYKGCLTLNFGLATGSPTHVIGLAILNSWTHIIIYNIIATWTVLATYPCVNWADIHQGFGCKFKTIKNLLQLHAVAVRNRVKSIHVLKTFSLIGLIPYVLSKAIKNLLQLHVFLALNVSLG
jgi:hypothetical protein